MYAITIGYGEMHKIYILKCLPIYAECKYTNIKFLRATVIKMLSNL